MPPPQVPSCALRVTTLAHTQIQLSFFYSSPEENPVLFSNSRRQIEMPAFGLGHSLELGTESVVPTGLEAYTGILWKKFFLSL